MGLKYKKLHGRGRLVLMRPTGIGYQVRHGITPVAGVAQFIGTMPPGQWPELAGLIVGEQVNSIKTFSAY